MSTTTPSQRRSSRVKLETPKQAVIGSTTPTPARSTRSARVTATVTPAKMTLAASGTQSEPRRGVLAGQQTPQAGPSTSQAAIPQSQPGRRVLPARIRRAAGGGQEGIRDLEEMIVDWLERYGLPSDTPPPTLPIYLTTLPIALVDPPTYSIEGANTSQPLITLTPTHNQRIPTPSPRRANLNLDTDSSEKIETPGWVVVKPGEDDEEEAREELGVARAKLSPLKRLRRLPHDENAEDTSDAYYIALHRRYEAFERRQKSREKEKLVFERYRMRSRIDLLKNMSEPSWANVVNTVLSRGGHPGWEKGRDKLSAMGAEWLKVRLVKEGKELVKRYDQLLPVEPRKSRMDRSLSNTSLTPERVFSSSPALSASPPPVLPARVTALRDPASQKRPRRSVGKSEAAETPHKSPRKRAAKQKEEDTGMESDDPAILLPRKRKRAPRHTQEREKRDTNADNGDVLLGPTANDAKPTAESTTQTFVADASQPAKLESLIGGTDPPAASNSSSTSDGDPPDLSESPVQSFFPPVTTSGLPCLLEAANRREAAIEESLAARARVETRKEDMKDGKKVSRFIAREKTRTSGRMGTVLPFGLPFPAELDNKNEFTITGEEDFWAIIAEREEQKTIRRRSSLMVAQNGHDPHVHGGGMPANGLAPAAGSVAAEVPAAKVSTEDVADMRAVEAAVVL